MSKTITGQTELMPTPVTTLNESHGVLEFSVADLADIDPERRVTLARLAMSLGDLFGPRPGAASKIDRALKTNSAHYRLAEPYCIQQGLIIPRDDPRYANADQLVKTTYQAGTQVAIDGGLKLPFPPTSKHPGVVFGADEYHLVARSAPDLVRAGKAQTQRANQGKLSSEEVRDKRNRSAAHIAANYIKKLTGLEAEYITDHRLLTRLHRQAKGPDTKRTPQNQYKAKNLDRDRRYADELFHETVETAAINNGWGQVAINGIHRAIASLLYRKGSSREIDQAWRRFIEMQGLYINARRFKLIQSRMACESQYSIYQPYLEAAEA